MKFLLNTFENSSYVITQEFQVSQTMRLERLKPWLAFVNVPSTAELTLTLANEDDSVIFSKVLTVADIEAAITADTGTPITIANSYYHGTFSFIPSVPLTIHAATYKLKIQRTDSFTPDTEAGTSWIGWVKQHDDPVIGYYEDGYQFASDFNRPYTFEIYAIKVV